MRVCVCAHMIQFQCVAEQTSDFHGISNVNQAAALMTAMAAKKVRSDLDRLYEHFCCAPGPMTSHSWWEFWVTHMPFPKSKVLHFDSSGRLTVN